MEYKAVKIIKDDETMHVGGRYLLWTEPLEMGTLKEILYDEKASHFIELKFTEDEKTVVKRYPFHIIEYLVFPKFPPSV